MQGRLERGGRELVRDGEGGVEGEAGGGGSDGRVGRAVRLVPVLVRLRTRRLPAEFSRSFAPETRLAGEEPL